MTTADRSLMVIVFFIKRSYKYSAKTHVVIVVTIINKAFILNGGMECIECGCCSYTCPAKRNMTQAFKKMKYLVSINKRK